MTRESLHSMLVPFGQEHVLRFWEELDAGGQERLAAQLSGLDLKQIQDLASRDASQTDVAEVMRAAPPRAMRADGSGAEWSREQARHRGEEAIARGEVGAILVAGGQGTRLGFDQPKGMFPIGPVSGRTLFEIFADRLKAIAQHYGVRIPLYVMTSDATDAATCQYFESKRFLGLDPDDVRIFRQGTMPAVDANSGKLLLAAKDSLALSPDGHGGMLAALDRTGCLKDAESRGVKHLSYIQVDNPLAALCDAELMGHHLLAESEMTTQVIRKRYPTERVGNVVSIDGRVHIIEYSDLPEEAAHATEPDGTLRFWAGNIAVHVLDVSFLRRMSGVAESLPFHLASKKVSFVDEAGRTVEPSQPNATKYERFIFDLLPSAENAFVVEALPSEAFAPVKNADGAEADTPILAKNAISALHRGWLESAGAVVGEGVHVEINPRYSLSSEQLAEKIPQNLRIDTDRFFDV